ncbi:ABC transporter permease [Serratia fonticola]|uniref:ABC transporter permease n=1 Tax=Serratia fonticola TaxID=47917 RepID=UPI003AAB8602
MIYLNLLQSIATLIYRRLINVQWLLFVLAVAIIVCIAGAFNLATYLAYQLDDGCYRKQQCSIWRIETRWISPVSGESGIWATSPAPLAAMIRSGFEGSFLVSSFMPIRSNIQVDETLHTRDAAFSNEGSTLDVFNWDMLAGKEPKFLQPGEALIVQEEAERLFGKGNESVLGKSFKINLGKKEKTFTVGTVIKSFPGNALFQPKLIVIVDAQKGNLSTIHRDGLRGIPVEWFKPNVYTFIKQAADSQPTNRLFSYWAFSNQERDISILMGSLVKNVPNLGGWQPEFIARSAIEARLTAGIYDNLFEIVTPSALMLLATVMILLVISSIVVVCFCFAITGTSLDPLFNSLTRIGIPTVYFYRLFIGLTIIFLPLTVLIGILLGKMASPLISKYFGLMSVDYNIGFEFELYFVFVVSLSLIVASMIGLYGANKVSKQRVQKVLSCLAFASGLFATGVLVVFAMQQQYIDNKPLGFNLNNKYVVDIDDGNILAPRLELIKRELKSIVGVNAVVATKSIPGDNEFEFIEMRQYDRTNLRNHRVQAVAAEVELLSMLGVDLLVGEYVSNDTSRTQMTTNNVVINRSAATLLGFDNLAEAFQQPLAIFNSDDINLALRIRAVVEDFHYLPPIEPIAPLLIYQRPELYKKLVIQYDGRYAQGVSGEIDRVMNATLPTIQYNKYLLADYYKSYNKNMRVVSRLVFIGCCIALLGVLAAIYGATRFLTLSRKREIALRRLTGAKVSQLLPFYLKCFSWPLCTGALFAIPSSIVMSSFWLGNFSFRISILDYYVVFSIAASMVAVALSSIAVTFICETPVLTHEELSLLDR